MSAAPLPGRAAAGAAYLERWAPPVDGELDRLLPAESEEPSVLHRAMRYSTLAPGKRVRGVMAVAACEATGGEPRSALPLAAALEMIHTYSLIHDDLPAMDDDDWRRGQPSCHRAFGEGTAILAGDALQSLAFEVLASLPERSGVSAQTALAIVHQVALAVGSRGMAGGQAEDLQAMGETGGPVPAERLWSIHRRKTAALLRASVVAGGLLGVDGGPQALDGAVVRALGEFGEAVGRAFQIIDDVLDVEADPREQRVSAAAVLGKEGALREAERLTRVALEALEPLGPKAGPLRDLGRFLCERTV
ncbi:MAG: polyprenyl synthetase family protein [Limnochordaceae bacterium]|nr:polyprenyl synthetase family protein [Limnochordaceae bacterium]